MKMILRMMVSLHTAGLIHGILRRAFTTTSSDTTNTSRHKKANTRSKPTNFYTQKASCHNASFQKQFRPFLHQALARKLCTKGFYIPQALHRHSFPAASFLTEENMHHEVYTSRAFFAGSFYPCLFASNDFTLTSRCAMKLLHQQAFYTREFFQHLCKSQQILKSCSARHGTGKNFPTEHLFCQKWHFHPAAFWERSA